MSIKLLSIDDIGLSNRSRNALRRAGVHNVGDMLECTEENLCKIRNIGIRSIVEIMDKIEEYRAYEEPGVALEMIERSDTDYSRLDWEEFVDSEDGKNYVVEFFKTTKVDVLEILSARAYNLLIFAGYEFLSQIVFAEEEELMKISNMDIDSAKEIIRVCKYYLKENQDTILKEYIKKCERDKTPTLDIYMALRLPEYKDMILQYVQTNDWTIEQMGLSNGPRNRLQENGYLKISDFIFETAETLLSLPRMGAKYADQIIEKIQVYLEKNESRILAVISGDESALWDDLSIREMVLDLFKKIEFGGLSFRELLDKLGLPDQVTDGRVKKIIGQLLAEKELEYVDYRCHRVYGRFTELIDRCPAISDRNREIMRSRLGGETLESIGGKYDLSRERIRQLEGKTIAAVREWYVAETGNTLFDEDYYRYLYSTYSFDKKEITEWLNVSESVWHYLEASNAKQGKKDLDEALTDKNLDISLRLRIKNYLNRNKLYIDDMWINKKRADLEEVVARKFCTSDITFDAFCATYNEFLQEEEIPYDENIYQTEEVYRTRKNRIADARFILWKQHETMRYYDIDGRDYTELIDALELESYENIELSTLKWFKNYPKIMEKYDIRDHYELHNLIRKVIPAGSFHDFKCGKMPIIKFGEFDRTAAFYDLLVANAPISLNDLVELIHGEYGYDHALIQSTYLQPLSKYYYQGIYALEQKIMSSEKRSILKAKLTDDFYYIDDLRKIYKELIPEADEEEINAYNLKEMGFIVLSNYVIQNHSSLDAYCEWIFTKSDIVDISSYRKKMTYVTGFSNKLMEMKRNLDVVEMEPNVLINFKKLEASGITRGMIQDYCDEVYDFVREGMYFSIRSIREQGFDSKLFELGFENWFYANLLLSDERFSQGTMFGNIILNKGEKNITIQSFIKALIKKAGTIDIFELISLLENNYGCKVSERTDIIYKVQGTEVYYDKILERFYATEETYYKELDFVEGI